jgi:hypothetical protein
MEVHHHPHVEKKNFKEYFLEFLMIFLAVTMGFFAENIREHFVNKEKENHYIKNLVADLNNDISQIDTIMAEHRSWHLHLDSALHIPIQSLTDINKQNSFLYHFFPFYSLVPIFIQTDNTISQLKSGGFNIFSHQATIDSISKVYNSLIKYNNDFFLLTYWDAAHQAQDIMQLPQAAISFSDPDLFRFRAGYPAFTQLDKEKIVQLYNKIGNANGTLITLILNEQLHREQMTGLLNFLKSQYPSE